MSKFRHAVLDCDENSPHAPVAIFLSTDGLDDCYPIFENEQWLYKLYADAIIDSMICNGLSVTEDAVKNELLPHMTEHGSNDDISLAYLVAGDLNLLLRSRTVYLAEKAREKFLPRWLEERGKKND